MKTPHRLIHAEDVSIAYGRPGRLQQVVHEVSFDAYRDEIVCIIGESGSGKTTFTDALLGLVPYKHAAITHGRIEFLDGRVKEEESCSIIGRELTYIPQDPNTGLDPLFSVRSNIDEVAAALFRDMNKKRREKLIEDKLHDVGINSREMDISSYPHQLSGGMKQRILIALALLSNPLCIIADEPTSNLDVTTEKKIMDLFSAINRDQHISFIITTHDLRLAQKYAHRVYVFYKGRIVEAGPVESVFGNPHNEYTKDLLRSAML